MGCRTIDLGGGVHAIACSRGVQPPRVHYVAETVGGRRPPAACGAPDPRNASAQVRHVTCRRCLALIRDTARFTRYQIESRQQRLGETA